MREQGFTSIPTDPALVRPSEYDWPEWSTATLMDKRRGKLEARATRAACGHTIEGFDWAISFPYATIAHALSTFRILSDGRVVAGGDPKAPACSWQGRTPGEAVTLANEFIRAQGYGRVLGDPQQIRWTDWRSPEEGKEQESAIDEMQRRQGSLEDEPFGLVCPSTLSQFGGPQQREWLVVYRYANPSKNDLAADEQTGRPFDPGGRSVVVPPSGRLYINHQDWSLGRVDRAVCR